MLYMRNDDADISTNQKYFLKKINYFEDKTILNCMSMPNCPCWDNSTSSRITYQLWGQLCFRPEVFEFSSKTRRVVLAVFTWTAAA